VIGMMGSAIDYSRASSARSQLQDSLDASILFAAQEVGLSDAQLKAFIRTRVETLMGNTYGADNLTLNVNRSEAGTSIEVTANMEIDTAMLGVMGINTIDIGANAEVTIQFPNLEVALVLDNTGSMRNGNRIGSLRTASLNFVQSVTSDGENDDVMISVVPYTAQVNIGNTSPMVSLLDINGDASHHAQMIEGQLIAKSRDDACDDEDFDGEISFFDEGGSNTMMAHAEVDSEERGPNVPGFSRLNFFEIYSDVIAELIGVRPADASSWDGYEYVRVDQNGDPDPDGCFIVNPDKISHWNLYQSLDGIDWRGCVEARPEPLDATDDAPDPSNPDTYWVPAFWLDDDELEDDDGDVIADDENNWMSDRRPDDHGFRENGEFYSAYKYNSSSGHNVDEVPNNTLGPAQGCGDPILPLTNNFTVVNQRINNMTYWNGGGTVTAQGVVWGWRALSPGAPFTEGAEYGDAKKVMIVMTDGENQLVDSDNPAFGSHYSAYSYLAGGILPPSSIDAAREYIDDRTLAACANAKEAGIIVYTVTFDLDSDGQELWNTCATSEDFAYHVDSASELVGAFETIAESVGELRLSK
ncbi:MAG: pilus assembly protein TadG-related protein, partial [Pseudomonadota bacterium]